MKIKFDNINNLMLIINKSKINLLINKINNNNLV